MIKNRELDNSWRSFRTKNLSCSTPPPNLLQIYLLTHERTEEKPFSWRESTSSFVWKTEKNLIKPYMWILKKLIEEKKEKLIIIYKWKFTVNCVNLRFPTWKKRKSHRKFILTENPWKNQDKKNARIRFRE